MKSAQFFTGASLLALLIVDICCFPIKKGNNPGASYEYGGSYPYAAPSYSFNQGAPSGYSSPGVVVPLGEVPVAPSYQPAPQPEPGFYQPASQPEPGFYQPAVQRQPSATAPSGYRDSSVSYYPAPSTQPGPAYQPITEDINWMVAPPGIFGGGDPSTAAPVDASRPENVSPPLPPPEPTYQAGELSHYESVLEEGDYNAETEEQGYLPPPPPPPEQESAEPGFTSPPQPEPRSWIAYPYYDYMFLTGQYPPGTITHSSSSYEQGMDSWHDAHYVRDYIPYSPAPVQQETYPDFTAPQSFQAPTQPVKSPGYGHGGAQPLPAASYGSFTGPGRFDEPNRSQAGGYNIKV